MTRVIAFIVIGLGVMFHDRSAFGDGSKLVIVVGKGSAVTNISRTDLKRCYTGEPVADGNAVLIPFNAAPNTPDRIAFDKAVLGMSPEQAGKFWIDRKIRGQSGAPRSLQSAVHVAKVAAKFPHAIGFVPVDQVTPDLQTVTVDGIAYTDARYRIVGQ